MSVVTSRPEIARRARTIWPMQAVPYSQSTTARPPGWVGEWYGYRWDCSGFEAAVSGQPAPGRSTATLDQLCVPITWDQAEPGDLWGKLGPRTEGASGHVAIIVETPRTAGHWVIVDHGGGPAGGSSYGPDIRTFTSPPSAYKPWRIKATMGDHMALGDRELSAGATGSDVVELQNALTRLGYSVGAAGADGQMGPATVNAVKAFQSAAGLTADGVCGPKTVAAIRVKLAELDQAAKLAELRPYIVAVLNDQVPAIVGQVLSTLGAGLDSIVRAAVAEAVSKVRLTIP